MLREYVPVALPLMLANVLCPSVLPDEVEEAQHHCHGASADHGGLVIALRFALISPLYI